jgi:hypothetical protein
MARKMTFSSSTFLETWGKREQEVAEDLLALA